ncbi:hypothetical protein RH915_11125 [Serpentinicella sp. ANB-PHB4]|uniref:hypothetical protein n=1 Tax=Serpentinicella sp. ANB-PHB4 TaxID=3074076 RepID=UPI00285E4018|nr:hypothetical protein [Serpentinicella sp. ANB-PHB4]MDR5660042.1 hypothetical protein [Serpentinicella sp. ANB-PHB4]
MKNENKILIALLVLILMSWLFWNSTRQVNNRVMSLQNQVSGLQNQVQQLSSRISSVDTSIHSIREDARPWTTGEIQFLEVKDGEADINISWRLREYKKGSEVALHYRLGDTGEFNKVIATKADGYYDATITVEVEVEPMIYMMTSKVEKRGNQNKESHVIDEKQNFPYEKEKYSTLTYYISVNDGDTVQTMESRVVNLDKINHQLFGTVNVDINYDANANKFHVFFIEDYVTNPENKIVEVLFQTRKAGKVVEEWKIDNNDEHITRGHEFRKKTLEPAKDFNDTYILIEYDTGIEVERKMNLP